MMKQPSYKYHGHVYTLISAMSSCTALVCFSGDNSRGGIIWLLASGIWLATARLAYRIAEGLGPDA